MDDAWDRRTEEEHLEYCRARALEYLDHDPRGAVSSLVSDLQKHAATAGYDRVLSGLGLSNPDELFALYNAGPAEVRQRLEQFQLGPRR